MGGGQCSLAGCTLDGSYPTGYSKDQKRSFRRKAKLNFSSQIWCPYIMHASSVSADKRRWRRVTIAEEERHRVITSTNCHASAEGKHRRDLYSVCRSWLDPLLIETVYCRCI